MTVMGDLMEGMLQSWSLKGKRQGWARRKGSLVGTEICEAREGDIWASEGESRLVVSDSL